MSVTVTQDRSFLDGVDLDGFNRPLHLEPYYGSPTAFCGYVFCNGPETSIPFEEADPKDICPRCLDLSLELA